MKKEMSDLKARGRKSHVIPEKILRRGNMKGKEGDVPGR